MRAALLSALFAVFAAGITTADLAPREEQMPDKVILRNCAIIAADEPACVRRMVEDLRAYLNEVTGRKPIRVDSAEAASGADCVIVVGRQAFENLSPAPDLDLPAEPQSYALAVFPGRANIVVAAGNDPRGTKYALVDLIREIRVEGKSAWLPGGLHRTEKPHFDLRGMYAHLHWQYNHPYALRSWSVEDWKRYVDLLALMKLNLFQIWTMAAICPNPLSPADEAYLRKYHEVVRYAKEVRGMEVWPGECANNVADSDFGTPIERREYFQVEVLKNPADPEQFRDIMENRANMYRLIDNGDGYWIIDSDPGKWPGSPASELADIFARNRALIDRYAEKGRDTKLVYWVHQGWGTGTPEENWRATIEGIREKVHEPWSLEVLHAGHLKVAADMGYIQKSVFFPYGAIEPEPSNPFTHIKFAQLAESFALALEYPGLAGVMGNAQTPFAQLPNIFYFAECAWDPERASLPPEEMLRRLARFLFPAVEKELAEGWLALTEIGSEQAFHAGRALEKLLAEDRIGPPGPGGRFIFPDPKLIVRDLALLLRVHGYAEQVRESVEANRKDEVVRDAVFGYLSGVLEWQTGTGFHGCRVNGVDFSGGGTLLHGRDFLTVYENVKAYLAEPGKKRDLCAEDLERRLRGAGFGESMSALAAFEVILDPGERRSDGRR